MDKFVNKVESNTKLVREIFDVTEFKMDYFLSQKFDANIFLKREDMTPVRSYKIRGAYCFINAHHKKNINNKDLIFICASAGNHAQGFAYSCKKLERIGKIYMPITTPNQKINMTKYWGGEFVEVILTGDTFDDAQKKAKEEARKDKNSIFVPPFDDADIVAGQATVAKEILDDSSLIKGSIDYLIVPVGGGGISAGISKYFSKISPNTKIITVEPYNANSLDVSIKNGKNTKLDKISTFVDGAAVKKIGDYNFKILKDLLKEKTIISPEGRLSETILEFLTHNGIILEPAGALSVDALKDDSLKAKIKSKNIVCVITGGNFDFERLPEIKEKSLKYSGLKKYIILRLPQRPGALKEFLNCLQNSVDRSRFEYLKKSSKTFGSVLIGLESKTKFDLEKTFLEIDKNSFEYKDITQDDMYFDLLI